jgi:hypothetical protein
MKKLITVLVALSLAACSPSKPSAPAGGGGAFPREIPQKAAQ